MKYGKSKATLELVTLKEKVREDDLVPNVETDTHTFELSETANKCVITLTRNETGWQNIHVTEETVEDEEDFLKGKTACSTEPDECEACQ